MLKNIIRTIPLVVIDKNLAKTELQEKIASILVSEGIKFTVYDKIDPEPQIELADEGAALAIKNKCDCVIGIGGALRHGCCQSHCRHCC